MKKSRTRSLDKEGLSELSKKYIFSEEDRKIIIWHIIVLVLAMLNFLIIPIEVAWNPSFTTKPIYILQDYLFDLIFLFDIVVNLRTMKVKEGEVISEPRRIAFYYLFSPAIFLDVIPIL